MEGVFVSRYDGSTVAGGATAEAAMTPAAIRQTTYCLNDKLVHRALGDNRRRAEMPALSAEAQNRFYERMFPSHICMATKPNDTADPLS